MQAQFIEISVLQALSHSETKRSRPRLVGKFGRPPDWIRFVVCSVVRVHALARLSANRLAVLSMQLLDVLAVDCLIICFTVSLIKGRQAQPYQETSFKFL